MAVELIKDQYYWVEDEDDSYTAARLISVDPSPNGEYQMELYEGSHVVWTSRVSIVSMIPSPGEITLKSLYDDLTDAVDISEPSILWNLHQRYNIQKIYSAIGPILIAINPYCFLEELYSEQMFNYFLDPNRIDSKGQPPHIWAIAREAYLSLKQKYVRQAIVISGESGAGKTETTKKCLQYLSAASMVSAGGGNSTGGDTTAIEDRVLGSNPLLESFGNSKTCRNNNSSRFGKWLEINFNCGRGKFCLVGANITQYLLEKSRVVSQAEEERNYHIFYQMCSDPDLGLGDPEDYAYLNQSGCVVIEGVDDYADFQETLRAFHDLNFSEEDRTAIFDALKAILYLGNTTFVPDSTDSGAAISDESRGCLARAAELLGFIEDDLAEALTIRTIQVRGEVMVVPLDTEQAVDTRNAFAKEIYGRLFSHIVSYANKSLAFTESPKLSKENHQRQRQGKRRMSAQGGQIVSIGLLDIFGFEIFTSNSFEQLCINYGNEKLQQYFINYVLKREQETYSAEGITVERVETLDNQDVLSLLESKPFGVFALLDEELRLPQGSDQGFIRKVEKEHKEKSSRFKRDFRMRNEHFEINHFAGSVLYDATNFLDKNKDKMYDHLESMIAKSSVLRFKDIMHSNSPDMLSSVNDSRKQSGSGHPSKHQRQLDTLASRFTGQLQQLVTVLQESEPHFVRCIKPNNIKSGNHFDADLVLRQLRYSGVLEAIQIRKSGYPTRKLHADFLASYRLLSGIPVPVLNAMESDSKRCAAVLEGLANKKSVYTDMKLGRTMVFYRPDVHNALEQDKMDVGLRAVLFIQATHRRHKAAERFHVLWDARSQVLTAMKWGMQNNMSEIDAIPDIYNSLQYCYDVDLQCYVVKEGRILLERLQTVSVCIDNLNIFLAEDLSGKYSDVVEEYNALCEVVKEAEQLEIVHQTFTAVNSKKCELRSRSEAVQSLRKALNVLDEEELGHCLARINELTDEFGPFCENERKPAAELHARLMTEIDVIRASSDILRDSQGEISMAMTDELGEAFESVSDSDRVRELLRSSIADLKKCVSPVLEKSGYTHPLTTIPSQNMLGVVDAIIDIRNSWLAGCWRKVADIVVDILAMSKSIWPPECSIVSDSLRTLSNSITRAIREEVALVAQGVDVHVVLPMLCEGVSSGEAEIQGEVSSVSVDPNPLEAAISNVKKIESIGAKASCLLHLVESVLSLRKAVHDDNFEVILALTESSPVTSCRFMRRSELYAAMESARGKKVLRKKSSMGFGMEELYKNTPVDCSGDDTGSAEGNEGIIEEFPEPPEKLSIPSFPLRDLSHIDDGTRLYNAMLVERSIDLSGPFKQVVDDIRREVMTSRKYAMERYAECVIATALEQPRTFKDESGSTQLILNKEHTEVISKSLEEVVTLWRVETNDESLSVEKIQERYFCTLSRRLYETASVVNTARTYFHSENYEQVLEMNRLDKFDIPISRRNNNDHWIPKVLAKVKEELLITVAESRNFNAKQVLLKAMKVGAVSGTIGQINKKDISSDSLKSGIRIAEECLKEDPRSKSTLKTLVTVAKCLIEARRAFQLLGTNEQRVAFRELENLRDHFPEEIMDEVHVMGCETDYRESTALLEKGLTLPLPVKYLLVSSEKSARRHSVMRVATSESSSNTAKIDIEDEFVPNMEVLSTELLQEGLEVARRLQERYSETALSPYLLSLIGSATLIQRLRLAVTNCQWDMANVFLKEIDAAKLAEATPCIAPEIAEANSVVGNALLVASCENALMSDQPQPSTVDLGFLDMSHATISSLEEAIHKCQTKGCKTRRADILYSALLIIRDLRRSVLTGDWGGARKQLMRAKDEGLGDPSAGSFGKYTTMCTVEIEAIGVAVHNQDALRALKTSLLEEAIKGRPGDIDCEKIEFYKLTAALGNVASVPSTSRGEFLMGLHSLSEIVLKGRKAASQSQWNIVRNLSSMWLEKIKQLKLKSTEITDELSSLKQRDSVDIPDPTKSESGQSFEMKGPSAVGSVAQFSKKEFDYLMSVLMEELDLLQNHVTMIQLEGEVSKALLENGVSSNEMVGQIDLSKIRTDGLELVLERKDALLKATNSTLPTPVEKLCKAAHLMLDIRTAILKGQWDSVPALLEEALTGTYHPLPDACRQEVQVIRLECENRWIINNISTALETGRLDGTVDDFKDTSDVNCELLSGAINACRTLTPRTDEALSLLHTSEEILKLRAMLVEDPTPWEQVRDRAADLLEAGNMHSRGLPEINLVLSVAENIMVCGHLEDEICKGRISGKPGNLDLTDVDVRGIAAACDFAMETAVKSKRANELLNASRSVMSLREALLRAYENPESASQALSSVKSIVQSMYEVKSRNPKDAGWLLCRNEVALVTQDAHIREVNKQLEDSVTMACRVYASRSAASIGGTSSSTRTSVNVPSESFLSCESLDDIISYVEKLDFSTIVLDDLCNCARSLRLLRDAVINSDWEYVNLLASREDVVHPISLVPYAVPELISARQEAHNRITANKLEEVLGSDPSSEDDPYHEYLSAVIDEAEASDITAISTQQLLECAKNVHLLRVGLSTQDNIQVAQALRWFEVNVYRCPPCVQDEAKKAFIMHQNALLITGLTAALQTGYATGELGEMNVSAVDTTALSKLLAQAHDATYQTPEVRDIVDVAEMIYCLRCAQRAKDNDGISKALEMLASWGKTLPAVVVEEVAFARSERDNSAAISALTSAFESFDVSSSTSLEMSLKITGDQDQDGLIRLSSDGPDIYSPRNLSKSRGDRKVGTPSSVSATSGKPSRRYSYASMNRADIDLDTIDICTLDEALAQARQHGLYTQKAKLLYKTVYTIRCLRAAMKQNDWPKVEELLIDLDANSGEDIAGVDEMAEKELQVIRNQLEMRTSIVDLSKALKTGWARCSNGIVDTDPLQVDSLIDAISRAERSMHDLGIASDMKKLSLRYSSAGGKSDIVAALSSMDESSGSSGVVGVPVTSPALKRYRKHYPQGDAGASDGKKPDLKVETTAPKSKVQEQVEKLLLSAAIVAEVRKALHDGSIQLAGNLSEEAIHQGVHTSVQDELSHYATEIGRALHMMRLCKDLREGITKGNADNLETIILEAREASVAVSGDLGLVRTLERAQSVLKSINKVRKELNAASHIYKISSIEDALEAAKKLNISGYLIDNATSRLAVLRQFETGLKDLNLNGCGMVTGRAAQRMIYDLATSLGIKNHPVARRAAILLHLNEASLTRVLIAEAAADKNSYGVATETIKIKKSFLRLPECQEEFSIEKFGRLRSPSEFSMRLALESTELKHSMLRHTDGLIGTSLTKLTPVLAALAVIIFTHSTKVLEENSSCAPEVLLRNLINLGRCCPIMRDEILMQCVKQIRENPSEDAELRVWGVLRACLKFFPPSNYFENYLECFLLSQVKSRPDARTVLSAGCIRHMHESIFLYGYNEKIYSPWDSSLKSVKVWLQPLPVVSSDVGGTGGITGISGASSSGSGGKSGRQLHYSLMDPAFVTTPENTNVSPSDALKISAAANIRGTRDNWICRFRLLSHDEDDVSVAEFGERLFASSPRLDKQDKLVLFYWICGHLPSKSSAVILIRELASDPKLFYPLDVSERNRSAERQKQLRNIDPPPRIMSTDSAEIRNDLVKEFWSSVVGVCVACDLASAHIQPIASSGTKQKKVVTPPVRKKGMLSHSLSDIAESPSPGSSPIDDVLPDVPIDEAFMMWEIYRDIIVVGMEKIASEYEQLQDRYMSNENYSPKKLKFSFTPISKDSSKSLQPSQRSRRMTSHSNMMS